MNDEIIDLDKFGANIFDDFSKNINHNHQRNNKSKKNKVPVVILSGFLGSGKTTLLNYILRNSPKSKIGVIINDFGKINIDAKLTVGNISENTIELSNGCICCILGDNGLSEPLNELANEETQPDLILIEASGIAEPYDLMQTLRFSGNKFTEFGGTIYLIDAKNFNQTLEKYPQHFEKCIKTADIILLNKTNLIERKAEKKIINRVRKNNPRAPIISTNHARIDTRILFDEKKNAYRNQSFLDENENCHEHIHNQFQSVSFVEKKPLDPKKFLSFLENLPENLFRAKGFCYFGLKGYEQKYLLQIVGKNTEISATEWDENEIPQTEIVLIGTEINERKLTNQLANLIDQTAEEINPENMMNFERYFIEK